MASRTRGDKAIVFFQLLFFALLAMGVVYLIVRWKDIPEQFPVHWNLKSRSEPDVWENRTPGGVFFPIALAAVIGTIVFAINFIKSVRLPLKAALVLLVYSIGLPLAITAVWFPFRAATVMPVGFIAMALIGGVVVNLVLLCTIFWALSEADLPPVEAASPDRRVYYSKWGFYRNPEDPALWAPKLYGYGWTINMGHRRGRLIAWASIVMPLAIIMAVIILAVILTSS